MIAYPVWTEKPTLLFVSSTSILELGSGWGGADSTPLNNGRFSCSELDFEPYILLIDESHDVSGTFYELNQVCKEADQFRAICHTFFFNNPENCSMQQQTHFISKICST